MRKVMNISVPEALELYVRRRVKTGDFGSVSEYFRELIRLDQRRERVIAASTRVRRQVVQPPSVRGAVIGRNILED